MANAGTSGLTRDEIIDRFFIENRTRVIEIAAFLDRLDRAGGAGDDFRMRAFLATLNLLSGSLEGSRVQKVQMILSDRNDELKDALDQKNADGAAKVPAGVPS